MTELYYYPVSYGIHDLVGNGDTGQFGLRIYYPSEEDSPYDAPIRPGRYPLVVFAHGDRAYENRFCPLDDSRDYTRWGAVLHLLARCGMVVIVPAMHDIVGSADQAAVRIEDAVTWVRRNWAGNATIHKPPELTTARFGPPPPGQLPPLLPLGPPTPLGLAGHSWGARACAVVAGRGRVEVTALASIAGTWDDNAANAALTSANLPTLLLAGTEDFMTISYLRAFWPNLPLPKHQAALQGLDHWDWFGSLGGIQPCNNATGRPACPAGWQIASELLLGFMAKYIGGRWYQQAYLLGSPQGRPPLLQWFDGPVDCALKIRWNDPMASPTLGNPGEVTLGTWDDSFDPW